MRKTASGKARKAKSAQPNKKRAAITSTNRMTVELDGWIKRLPGLDDIPETASALNDNQRRTWVASLMTDVPQAIKTYWKAWDLVRSAIPAAQADAIRHRLGILATTGFLQENYRTELARQDMDSYPEIPIIVSKYEVSPLFPHADDISAVYPPGADVSFMPVPFIASVELGDIRPAHGGRDGFLFIRGKVKLTKSSHGRLLYGSDGPVKVWVNGREAGCQPKATNPARIGQYSASVEWREGENEILFGINTNHGLAWGVQARMQRD